MNELANFWNIIVESNTFNFAVLLVIFAVTIGGAYFGVLGMFLAVPVFTVIKMLIEDFVDERETKKCQSGIDKDGLGRL